jgi:hypothetical protein
MSTANRFGDPMFYILVVAPMDQVFIGPFETDTAADDYAAAIRAKGHDAFTLTKAEMFDSMEKFGALPVQTP